MTIDVDGGNRVPSFIRTVPALGWNAQQNHTENARANDARQSRLVELAWLGAEKMIEASESCEERKYYFDRLYANLAESRAQAASDHAISSNNQTSALEVAAVASVTLAVLGTALYLYKKSNDDCVGDVSLIGGDPFSL